MQDTGLISSILGAQTLRPGMSSPNVPLLSDPKRSRPVLESPIKHVAFLFFQLTQRKVSEYLTPLSIEPLSIKWSNISCDFLVMWYMERSGQLSTDSEPESRSINLMLHELPRDNVKTDDSGSMVTSRSECRGRKLSAPSYLLMRQEFMRGEFWGSDSYLAMWSWDCKVLILSNSGFSSLGIEGTFLEDLEPVYS